MSEQSSLSLALGVFFLLSSTSWTLNLLLPYHSLLKYPNEQIQLRDAVSERSEKRIKEEGKKCDADQD